MIFGTPRTTEPAEGGLGRTRMGRSVAASMTMNAMMTPMVPSGAGQADRTSGMTQSTGRSTEPIRERRLMHSNQDQGLVRASVTPLTRIVRWHICDASFKATVAEAP